MSASPADDIRGAPPVTPLLGRFGVLFLCFALGVLGALGIAAHVGGCGGGTP
jgi:hypothetical protein